VLTAGETSLMLSGQARRAFCVLSLALTVGCGARTLLAEPNELEGSDAGGEDADAGSETGRGTDASPSDGGRSSARDSSASDGVVDGTQSDGNSGLGSDAGDAEDDRRADASDATVDDGSAGRDAEAGHVGDGSVGDAGDASTEGGGRVVAYFPLDIAGTYLPSQIDFSVVTDVVEHAVCTDASGNLNLAALGKEFPVPDLVAVAQANGAKAILGLCADPGTDVFGAMASSPLSQANYVANVTALVDEYGFDGVDIDWEYPASMVDESSLTTLVSNLRVAIGASASLSITGPPTSGLGQYYDMAAIMPDLDWFSIQTYGYAGPSFSTHADPNAPLNAVGGWYVERSAQYFLAQGVPSSRLLIGLPFFGNQYAGASALGGKLVNDGGSDSVEYGAIVPLIDAGWTRYWDNEAGVPYLLLADGGDGVVTYDDPTSIAGKCAYAQSLGLGGAIVWNLGQDVVGAAQPLLSAAGACR
jgi:Glycosyl hydrolases family 18